MPAPTSRCSCGARVDESHLTGEADAVGKRPDTSPLIFSGSKVLEGGGRALVTAVGANSQQGLISGMVASAQEQGDSLRYETRAHMLRSHDSF